MSKMSQDDSSHSATETLTAEFRDGQLQIVEVTPFEKNSDEETETIQVEADGDSGKFMEVYDSSGKGMLQLDLLNLTFVRCEGEDGDQYRLVTNSESEEAGSELQYLNPDDATVTCVLQSSDGEEPEVQESYVMVEGEHEQSADSSSYVMVEGDQGIVLLQSEPSGSGTKQKVEEKPQTTYDILERAKALRKAKRLLDESLRPQRGRGRRRRDQLPAARDLLASPDFKLFLYSCKLCSFKCNAIRELTSHRSTAHGGGGGPGKCRGAARTPPALLQCPRCPYRGNSTAQLLQHAQIHSAPVRRTGPAAAAASQKTPDDAIAEAAPDSVLVCGACGFESVSRPAFRAHIAHAHQTMVAEQWLEDEKEE